MQPGDPGDVMQRPSDLPDAVLRYAPHDDGVVDVHLPPGQSFDARPRPLVVYVHGGFWRQAYDRTHARPFAEALAREGFVVAVPEYRRGPSSWRDTFADLGSVMSGLDELLGRIDVTTTTTTLVGHSAGGHLVLWLASEGYDVRRVVALAPAADLVFADATGMGDGAAEAFLGGRRDAVPEVYDAADPGTRLAERPDADVTIVHGDVDDAVDVASSRGLAGRYAWIDYRELAGVDHSDVIDPLSAAWPTVLDACRGGTLEA